MNNETTELLRLEFKAIRDRARDISLHDFARSLVDPIAIAPGTFSLATTCTWHTIWHDDGVFGEREYRIWCDTGSIEVEIDDKVDANKNPLNPGNSMDVSGKKIRVHALANNSDGRYERL